MGDARLFQVCRIDCAGRNYADHAHETGHAPALGLPSSFPNRPMHRSPRPLTLHFRPATRDLQHGIDLGIALCGHPRKGRIEWSVNRQMRQADAVSDMILDVQNLRMPHYRLVEPLARDRRLTVTSAGVAAPESGDVVMVRVDQVSALQVRIRSPSVGWSSHRFAAVHLNALYNYGLCKLPEGSVRVSDRFFRVSANKTRQGHKPEAGVPPSSADNKARNTHEDP